MTEEVKTQEAKQGNTAEVKTKAKSAPAKEKPAAPVETREGGKRVVKLPSGLTVTYN